MVLETPDRSQTPPNKKKTPVNQSIDVTRQVATYDDAIEILKTKPCIVVTDCICRKRKVVINEGCGKTMEACFMC